MKKIIITDILLKITPFPNFYFSLFICKNAVQKNTFFTKTNAKIFLDLISLEIGGLVCVLPMIADQHSYTFSPIF